MDDRGKMLVFGDMHNGGRVEVRDDPEFWSEMDNLIRLGYVFLYTKEGVCAGADC